MIGGVYTDPNHSPTKASANLYKLKDPWFGGLRFLGQRQSSQNTKDPNFVCIGCDDGIHFWTLTGTFTDLTEKPNKITMDFTPKAPGVGLLQCGFDSQAGAIHFYEDDGRTIGNTWRRLQATMDSNFALEQQFQHAAFNDVNGLYVDPETFNQTKKVSTSSKFAGIRVVSDRLGKYIRDEICVVGTDDGVTWWSTSGGAFTNKFKGEFTMGSPSSPGTMMTAKCKNGTIDIQDGDAKWIKMAPKMDIHSLPQQGEN